MSDDLNGKAPMWFYVVGGIFFLWNFTGLALYYQHMTTTPEAFAAVYTPVQVAFVEATPAWANAAYATAVTFGFIASILLLLRNAWAPTAFIISFVGIILQDLESFVVRDVIAVFGEAAFFIPPVVLIIAIVEIWYSKSVANRYYR